MRREVDSETLYRAAAGIALAIGVLALIPAHTAAMALATSAAVAGLSLQARRAAPA